MANATAFAAAAVVKYGILSNRATDLISRLSLIDCTPSVVFITNKFRYFSFGLQYLDDLHELY